MESSLNIYSIIFRSNHPPNNKKNTPSRKCDAREEQELGFFKLFYLFIEKIEFTILQLHRVPFNRHFFPWRNSQWADEGVIRLKGSRYMILYQGLLKYKRNGKCVWQWDKNRRINVFKWAVFPFLWSAKIHVYAMNLFYIKFIFSIKVKCFQRFQIKYS